MTKLIFKSNGDEISFENGEVKAVNVGHNATRLHLQHEAQSPEYALKIQGTEGELKFTQRKTKACNCNPGTNEFIAYDLNLPSWFHVLDGIVNDKWADHGFIGKITTLIFVVVYRCME